MARIWLVAAPTLDEIFIQVLQERGGRRLMTRIWLVAAPTLDEIFIQVLQGRGGGDS